jgi:hypothetical protein
MKTERLKIINSALTNIANCPKPKHLHCLSCASAINLVKIILDVLEEENDDLSISNSNEITKIAC